MGRLRAAGRGPESRGHSRGADGVQILPGASPATRGDGPYHTLVESTFDLGAVRVIARYLNHPGIALGYRLEADGVSVVYATDHEPHSRHQAHIKDAVHAGPVHREDERHIEFLVGADLVIHDAQYTLEEYPQKVTWGHSPAEQAVDFALAAGAKRLALFHHDPMRTDEALDRLVEVCRGHAMTAGGALEVFAAAEGQVIELASWAASRVPVAEHPEPLVATTVGPCSGPLTIVLADDDPDILRLLTMTLRSEGFRLLTANDGDSALEMARAERPDLLLLDWNMPGRSGLEVCRALRAEADPRLRDMPVVMLTARGGAEETAAGFAAGVTDYVTKPFKPTHVRSRVHTWLLRRRAGAPEDA